MLYEAHKVSPYWMRWRCLSTVSCRPSPALEVSITWSLFSNETTELCKVELQGTLSLSPLWVPENIWKPPVCPLSHLSHLSHLFSVCCPLSHHCACPLLRNESPDDFFSGRIQMVETQHAKHAKITPRTSVQWKQRMFMDTSQNIPCNLGWFVVQPTSSQQVTVAMGNLSWPWQSRKDQRLQTSISPLYICTMDLDTYMHNNIGSTNFFISTPCKGMTPLVQAKSVWDVTIMNMIYKFIR